MSRISKISPTRILTTDRTLHSSSTALTPLRFLLTNSCKEHTWDDGNNKGELGSRVKTNFRTSTQQQRSQIQRTTRSIGGHEFEVVGNSTFTSLDEQGLGDGSHAGEFCRVDHTLGVGVGAEDADLAVLASECFDSFETLFGVGGWGLGVGCECVSHRYLFLIGLFVTGNERESMRRSFFVRSESKDQTEYLLHAVLNPLCNYFLAIHSQKKKLPPGRS